MVTAVTRIDTGLILIRRSYTAIRPTIYAYVPVIRVLLEANAALRDEREGEREGGSVGFADDVPTVFQS